MNPKKTLGILVVAAMSAPLLASADTITLAYDFSAPYPDSSLGPEFGPGEIAGTPPPVESIAGSFRFTFDPDLLDEQEVTPDAVDLTIFGFEYTEATTSVLITYTSAPDLALWRDIRFGGSPDPSSATPATNDFTIFLGISESGIPAFGAGRIDYAVDGIDDYWSGISLVELSEGPVVPPSVPEPGTLALLGLGLAGIGFARRRKA